MTGALLAIASACLYGLAGVTLRLSGRGARGDNGVYLSVLVTAALAGLLWLARGQVPAARVLAEGRAELAIFALAGLCATVFGRIAFYRATERIGAVRASLCRRLIPVFALPVAFLLAGELPDGRALLGGAVVLAAVLAYLGRPEGPARVGLGEAIGIGSALFYALAYSLRALGLESLPDAALGTFVGALAGCLWFPLAALLRGQGAAGLRRLLADRGRWHWATAAALSLGQILQFFALQHAPVVTVAVLGSLDVFVSALLARALLRDERVGLARLLLAGGAALVGTAILFS